MFDRGDKQARFDLEGCLTVYSVVKPAQSTYLFSNPVKEATRVRRWEG